MPPKRTPRRATRKRPRRRASARRRRASRTAHGARAPAAAKVPIQVPAPWRVDRGGKSISVEVKTKNFIEAVDIVNEIRDVAEHQQHHPDLHIEKWNHLRIRTYSHDVGHLTDRDERLSHRISELLRKRGLA